MEFTIELVWNREFNWTFYKREENLEKAIEEAISIRDSGDGARIKKIRIIDNITEQVVWNG